MGSCYREGDYLIEALRIAAAIEAGTHKIVPVEPTEAMVEAWFLDGSYKAMLSAYDFNTENTKENNND